KGGEVLVCKGDVANEEQMLQVVQEAEELFGQIHGVIHAAGILHNDNFGLIKDTITEESEEHFKAKIYGTLILGKVLKDHNIDFAILMSSLSSTLGGLGHVVYASANKFMDVYALGKNRGNNQNWICVNWDVWQNKIIEDSILVINNAIRYEEGMKALDYIIDSKGCSQVLVSTGELQDRIDNWLNLEKITDTKKKEKAKSISEWKDLEKELARIFKEMIGVEKISKNDNFFEMGATSLTLIQVNEQIKHELKLNISIEKLFTYPTIYELVNYLKEDSSYGESFLDTEKQKAVISESKDIAVIGMAGRFPGA
ncbi:SDR family oxidoreductase, partial [Croceitalea marina]